ncbi:MAG TPA: glutamate--tRNA ligase family protein [Gemmatimonadales bacterium]|nr:glutamate--tRNA ligase family protein [Gemmatimonadales bacterium]
MPPLDLPALARRLTRRPRTRFAPSPTGYLHLGHAVNAVYVWGLARALGGQVVLRLEDHDRLRCRPEYERALLEDLDWLGLEPDLGRAAELRAGRSPYRQSDRGEAYAAALARLSDAGAVFGCDCSRREIDAEAGGAFNRETRYPGRCRTRGLALDAAGVRLRMDPGEERFLDPLRGEVCQDPAAQCGDMLLRDRLGHWTYQFAVVADDIDQEIDLVIRGEDLVGSTGRQIRLARLLGRERPPVFLHHPLVRKADGAKLSKANRDDGIRDLRAAGVSAADVLGRAAWLGGLLPAPMPLRADGLAALFSRS